MSRPGSGHLWVNRLTSPKAPVFRCHSRSLIKSSKKLKEKLMKGAQSEKANLSMTMKTKQSFATGCLMSPLSQTNTTIIIFNINNMCKETACNSKERKAMDSNRLVNLSNERRKCQCGGN